MQMGMMNTHTFTIFNKAVNKVDFTEKYNRKVLTGFFDETHGSNILKTGVSGIEGLNLMINFDEISTYLKPKEYQSKAEAEQNKYWTLQGGDKVVKGIVDKDYTSMAELERELDGVYTITTVDTKDFGTLKHFEVLAK